MGTFIDQIQKQTDQIQKINTQRERKEIERIKRQNDKIHKNNLSLSLQEYFYKRFKKYQGNTKNDKIDYYDITTRERIIAKIANNNDFDATYLNSIYEKELHKITKIFENNDKHINKLEEESKQKEQEVQNKIKEQEKLKQQKHNFLINIVNLIGKVIKWFLIVLFGGIYFIFKIISTMAKSM